MNHSIFSDCKGSAFFKCGHLFSAEVIPVLFTDFRIFAALKLRKECNLLEMSVG